LEIDTQYVVAGMRILDGVPLLGVVSDVLQLVYVPHTMFDIIDPHLPSDSEFQLRGHVVFLEPAPLHSGSFSERLAAGDLGARAVVRALLRQSVSSIVRAHWDAWQQASYPVADYPPGTPTGEVSGVDLAVVAGEASAVIEGFLAPPGPERIRDARIRDEMVQALLEVVPQLSASGRAYFGPLLDMLSMIEHAESGQLKGRVIHDLLA
jgi:hypothetical protein